MKVVLLASANSIHAMRWANGLSARGVEVHVATLHQPMEGYHDDVKIHRLLPAGPLGYGLAVVALRRLLDKLAPDLMNVHYATGYGLLARLSGFVPTLLSVWGSDVYDFPLKSALHCSLVRGNLQSATSIASTSHCMARRVKAIWPQADVAVTPFGVDDALFKPMGRHVGRQGVVIGTVKTLEPKYGVDTLIEAFARARASSTTLADMRLEITGGGAQQGALMALAATLGVGECARFHGAVAHASVPAMLGRLDVYAALSRLESFGVAAVEAAMCGLPVVVSDAEGLAEVVEDGVTGYVVPRDDPQAAAAALAALAGSEALRQRMGQAGRERALARYTWEGSVDTMIKAYETTIAKSIKRESKELS